MASAAKSSSTGGGQTLFLWRWLCRYSVQTRIAAPLLGIAWASAARPPFYALFSATFRAYIENCRREPAMAINGRRNKPIGPGGSTRRLHH